MRILIFELRKPKNSFTMDETRKIKQSESEFSQDKEKAILAGLGAVTGAAAVGAAVYSHEVSEENKVDASGDEESEFSVHTAQQNGTDVSTDASSDNEVEVVVAENEDGDLASGNLLLADEMHAIEVESVGSEVEFVVDTELDGAEWNEGEVLNSDEQIISDLQGNDDIWEGTSYISEHPDVLDAMDDNTGFDNGDPYSYMA